MIESKKELKYGKYGTTAQEIYDKCCDIFNWDRSKRGNFGKQQKLYAKNAAGALSVWFIANSDWTDTNAEKWENILGLFADPITEKYMKGEMPSKTDQTNRIVFAKKKDGSYYFIGVYEVLEQNKKIRIYKQSSDTYSFEE